MQHIQSGYRGLSVLFGLNMDRVMYFAAIAGALMAGAFIGSL